MFICFEKYSSVINLDLFWKNLLSHIHLRPETPQVQQQVLPLSFMAIVQAPSTSSL